MAAQYWQFGSAMRSRTADLYPHRIEAIVKGVFLRQVATGLQDTNVQYKKVSIQYPWIKGMIR